MSASEPLGGGMDIHKPKPWHGVREFLKEYVIIVVGVLTALGAEQGVEWLHWQAEGRKHRIGAAHGTGERQADAQERIAVERCVDRRIDHWSAA